MENRNSLTLIFLVVALIFVYVRPYEIIPFLEQLKITKVSLLLALVFSFIERHRKGFLFKEKSFRLLLFLELLTLGLIPFSLWPANSYDFWINSYLKVFIVYYLLLIMASDFSKLNMLVKTIFFCCTVIAARAALAFYRGNVMVDADGTKRVSGVSMLSSNDPNDIALAFAMAVPLGMYLAYSAKGAMRYLYAAFAFTNIIAIVFTGSRGGYLGLLLGLAVFFAMMYRKRKAKLILIAVLGSVLALVLVPEQYQKRFWSAFDTEDYSYTDEKAGRVGIWKRGLKSVVDDPWGAGIRNYVIVEGERKKEDGFTGRWNYAHNSYIQIAVELGVAGLAFYLLFLWEGFRNLKKVIAHSEGTEDARARLCAYSLTASLIAFSVSSLFLSQAYYWNQYLFVALAVSLRKIAVDGAASPAATVAA